MFSDLGPIIKVKSQVTDDKILSKNEILDQWTDKSFDLR